jgi:hypothetical protein
MIGIEMIGEGMIEEMTEEMTVDALGLGNAGNATDNHRHPPRLSPLWKRQRQRRPSQRTRKLGRKLNSKLGKKNERPKKPSTKPKPKQWLLPENLHQVSLFWLCASSALHDFTPLDPMPS